MRTHLLFMAALCASTSCKPDVPSRASAAPAAPAPPTGLVASSQPHAMEPSQDLSALAERLAWEAQNRPALDVTAERVFDALERAGVSVLTKRQYVGITMGASYCAGGMTRDDVAISVCEYASRTAAAAGKDFMDHRFARMTPFARRVVHGQVLLSITKPSANAGMDVVQRAVDTFTSL